MNARLPSLSRPVVSAKNGHLIRPSISTVGHWLMTTSRKMSAYSVKATDLWDSNKAGNIAGDRAGNLSFDEAGEASRLDMIFG